MMIQMFRWFCYLSALVSLMPALRAQDRSQARSMVISEMGIVATSQTLASEAGAQILARGGSAADAAIAANAVLNVVEPMMNGIGGDLFAIYRQAGGAVAGLNSSGPSPAGLTREKLLHDGLNTMPSSGIHSVTVPGCVAGWWQLHRKFGKLPWKDLFAPAIYYASHGFPVTEIIAAEWRAAQDKLRDSETARAVFLPGGKPPETGELFRNPALAKALSLIAATGPDAFYRGPIGQAIVSLSSQMGGTMASTDLASFQPEWVAPLHSTYRGWKISELPPNSQGVATLEMLGIMQAFPLPQMLPESPEAWHIKIEAQKLAYADLARYVADPRFAPSPAAALLQPAYLAARAGLISPSKAACQTSPGQVLPAAGDTVYLAAIDSAGNIASLIQSIYLAFGSGIVVPGYGFHLHNRGGLFTLEEGHPNVLAPGKRPFHTIIPGLMEKGDLAIGFGIMGGLNQAQAHAQFVSNIADHGMNIQAALEAPRFTKLDFGGCGLQMEARVPAATREALAEKGHQIALRGDFSGTMGGGQAVMLNRATRVKFGASSPRKDGAAVPEPARYFDSNRATGLAK